VIDPVENEPSPSARPSSAGVPSRPMESWSRELDLRDLAARFGTPLYVHHPATLRENFEAWVRLVGAPGNVRYPVKANPSPLVVDALASWGSGADCASRPEVRRALAAGVPVERVSYNTPAFEPALAFWLLRAGGTVVADSPQVLETLRDGLEEPDFPGQLLVRVNPGGLPGYKTASGVQRYTSHGSAQSQFGIPSEELAGLLDGYPLPVSGLHVHVGTQMDNLDTFVEGLGFLHRLADLLRGRTGHPIASLNLGGGLGIPFLAGQDFPSIGGLTEALAPRLRDDFRYEVEPGNALVGDAFALLTRIIAVKETRSRRWAIADVGTDQLVKFTVARWEHEIVGPAHEPLSTEGPDGLAGPLCFAGDVLLPATRLDELAAGDPLLVRHAGAYCEAIASRFNGRTGAATVVVGDGGEARLAARREDPFFEPALQGYEPPGLTARAARRAAATGATQVAGAEPHETAETVEIPAARLDALHSEYMHELAADDGYEIVAAEHTGERSYELRVATRAAVGFVAVPLALRIFGDAAIVAVGLELGWENKRGPVWATRIAMTCGKSIPSGEEVPCRVVVSGLAPSGKLGGDTTGHVWFSLGENGEFRGTAKVSVPPPAAP